MYQPRRSDEEDERNRWVRVQFAEKRTRQWTLVGILLVAVVALRLGLTPIRGEAIYLVLLPLVVVYFIVTLSDWRCPACNRYLGRSLNPRYCSNCGARLR